MAAMTVALDPASPTLRGIVVDTENACGVRAASNRRRSATVAAKTSGVADAFTQPGLWFYAASALVVTMTHYLLQWRGRDTEQQKRLSQVQEP